MKLLLLCAVLSVTISTVQNIALPTADEVFRVEYCNDQTSQKRDECSSFRCNKDNSKIIGVGCAEARCSGKIIGYKGNPSKPYPECCIIPVCDDFTE